MRYGMARWRRFVPLLAAGLALLVAPGAASAADLRSGDDVTIPATEPIDQDLYVAGGTVRIDSRVNGDVYVAARSIVVNGAVSGNIFAIGETVTINGAAGHGVKAAGNTVVVDAPAGTDLFAAGQNVLVGPNARVDSDVFIGATRADVAGRIGGRLLAGGASISVAGSVQGESRLEAEQVAFSSSARFGGPVTYVSDNEAAVSPGVEFVQPPQHVLPQRPEQPTAADVLRDAIGGGIARFLILLGVGALVLWLARRSVLNAARTIHLSALAAFGIGAAVFFIPPIVIVVLAILLGIIFGALFGGAAWLAILVPAVLALALWWLALYLSPVIVGTWLGRWLLRLAGQGEGASPFLAVAIGLALIILVSFVPVLGGLINWLIVPIFGAGALAYSLFNRLEIPPAAPFATTPIGPGSPPGVAPA